MKKIIVLCAVLLLSLTFVTGCGARAATHDEKAAHKEEKIAFIDDLGREVALVTPQKVGIASGSFTETWVLAGGTPTAVTEDVLEDGRIELTENIISLGFLREPSVEKILEADLDFVILLANLESHVEMSTTLSTAGIPHAYFEMETFDDYLRVLNIFTEITGRADLYEENGTKLRGEIERILAEGEVQGNVDVLVMRASSVGIQAMNSETMVGTMLKDLGCTNIADQGGALLDEVSLEAVLQENPDYIFVTYMGDENEARAQMEHLMTSNPAWQTLDAVKEDRYVLLEKELFHYKPTVRWGESYGKLAEILSDD